MADKTQLETLTDQMKGWQSGSGADLKLSEAGRNKYLGAIGQLRTKLEALQKDLGPLKTVGNAGTYDSAIDTRQGVQDDATTLDKTITEYLAYLTAYEQTVKDACNRMIQSG
jgi:hypothetical protein